MMMSTKKRVKAEKPPAEPPQIVKDYWMFLGEIAERLLAENGEEILQQENNTQKVNK
jgi:hypothetical protein